MKHIQRTVALLLVLVSVFGLAACGKKEEEKKTLDPQAAFQALLTQLEYDTELKDVGDSGAMYFPDLPEGATVKMYAGSGYYADKVALITVAQESDVDAAMNSVKTHVQQLRSQFQSYIPEEVPKIDNAVIWQQGTSIILCISPDYQKAQSVIDGAEALGTQPPETTEPSETQESTEGTTQPTEPSTEGSSSYPTLTSKSGTYSFRSPIFQVDDSGFEGFRYIESSTKDYADVVNKIAENLKGVTKVYALPVPTSIGIVLPDDIRAQMKDYADQGEAINALISMLSDNVTGVSAYDNLMQHRDEYLYFKTDHHWTARGAYYAYEALCKAKGVTPYTLEQRESVDFTGFRGSLTQYMDIGSDVSDTITAYYPYNRDATMTFTDKSGAQIAWPIINDVSGYGAAVKYSTFAAGDNPFTEFHNPSVTDGSVCIVVKESYGCALMPFIVDHYSTVYEIDYRYWDGSLTEFAKKVGADEMIFANNTMRINEGLVAGDLNRIA